MDGDDVRVVEQRRRLRLALEALERLVAGPRPRGERLQGDEAVEDGVVGLVDLAHRAAAELADDPVLADHARDPCDDSRPRAHPRAEAGGHVSTGGRARTPCGPARAREPVAGDGAPIVLDAWPPMRQSLSQPRSSGAAVEGPWATTRTTSGSRASGSCFREHGLALTPQRRAILRAVLDLDDHPSADHVHAALARRRVRISRATVYRTLETFVRLGVITKVCHPGSSRPLRRRIDRHHHLICLRCDGVIDIADARLDALPVPDTWRSGFAVSDFQVQLRGSA